ncbi:LOW QUALITY PROTEIN: hypothetical protein SETIT_9G036500v2 [Setaria italica]|uniref:NAD-dependent epimerase/dehydratase domain-containing protein n=1 Tax=Setaria italica TaxID=4555 RepID=A0A368SCR5_SETIT|nr:LOW QUALITY PROTEIN: hypothetical protein SETIT_9G036500v2 [Setaria italica]
MASVEGKGETVLVTASRAGFIGSTLVRHLLDRGYNVHAGVLNPDDKAETDHLLALAAGAGEGRLSIFRCDLFDGAALLDAARGCPGVFHLASPCIIDAVSDPQKQLMVPAVEGTLNVLRAAKEAGGVRRVVVTSSISAIVPSPGWPAGEVRDGRCWTDVDYCEENGDDTQPGLVRAKVVGSKKLIAMGMQFSPMEKIIRDAVESLKSRGYIS